MARPKPPEPLINRNVRMTERQWAKWVKLGGVEWMRNMVQKSHIGFVDADRKLRNRRVRIDRIAGMLIKDIAVKHRISQQTVMRILK